MEYCPDCGARLEPGDSHCYSCGRRVRDAGVDSRDDGYGGSDFYGQGGPGDQYGQGSASDQYGQGGPGDQYGQGGREYGGRYGEERPTDRYGGERGGASGRQSRQTGRAGRARGQAAQQGGHWGAQQGGHWGAQQGASQPHQQGQYSQQQGRYVEDGKISYAIHFPLTDGWEPVIFGAVCYFLSFLLVPLFPMFGYVYRLIEAAAYGDTIQPKFQDLGALTKDGLLYFLLFLVYGVVLLAGIVLFAVLGDALGVEGVALAGILVWGTVVSYLGPAVFVLYPVTDSFIAAFSPKHVAEFAFTSTYFVSFLLFLALNVAFYLAMALVFGVLFITVIGWLLLFPLSYAVVPYSYYLYGAFWGGSYYEAAQEGVVPRPEAYRQETAQSAAGTDQYQY